MNLKPRTKKTTRKPISSSLSSCPGITWWIHQTRTAARLWTTASTVLRHRIMEGTRHKFACLVAGLFICRPLPPPISLELSPAELPLPLLGLRRSYVLLLRFGSTLGSLFDPTRRPARLTADDITGDNHHHGLFFRGCICRCSPLRRTCKENKIQCSRIFPHAATNALSSSVRTCVCFC